VCHALALLPPRFLCSQLLDALLKYIIAKLASFVIQLLLTKLLGLEGTPKGLGLLNDRVQSQQKVSILE
jgi:hypothetical protein